ncbi:MAG: DUF4347 domain-containing protein [Methylococcaceae bacterium]|nr:MAG: DUF4347 domain-containing protein [Methylococcaceae bacterium]
MHTPAAITFIDGSLPGIDTLIAGLPAGASYFVLDKNRDGLQQMVDILANYHDLSAIHVISHGAPGSLRLGTAVLDQASLDRYAGPLSSIGQSLAETGDLLLYGCDVAAGDTGKRFIADLARLTGADVAASVDATGAAALGGDWALEEGVGVIDGPALELPYDRLLGLSVTPNTLSFMAGHSLGEFWNEVAFAVIKADGSVVTWGDSSKGGDSSAVASLLNGTTDVTQIFSTGSAFAALREDGSVVTWGNSEDGGDSSAVASLLNGTVDVTQIFSTATAFAALRDDGSVVTWGNSENGGDSSAVVNSLNGTTDVTQIFSTGYAFAALKADGSVVAWGYGDSGGNSSAVSSLLNGTTTVTQIFSTVTAFAALRADGSVVTWGNSDWGGNSSAVASSLNGTTDTTQIFSTGYAFAALRVDGSVVTWGDRLYGGDSSAVASALNGTTDVTQIFSTSQAFAALRTDGSVVTWGRSDFGGDSSAVASALNGSTDVTQISSNGYAFAALRADGSVVAWGNSNWGGDSSTVTNSLNGTTDVTQIFSTITAFAALRTDGSVVTWGYGNWGGDSSSVVNQINGGIDVKQIFPTVYAFAALRADGSVVTWGDSAQGGNSSTVSSQLASGVVSFANVYTNDVYTNEPPSGNVSISDTTPTQGQTLAATNTLADADGLDSISYQWKAGNSNVGAGSTYTPTAADVGKAISVTAGYTDGSGNWESKTSAATAAVQGKPGYVLSVDGSSFEEGDTAVFHLDTSNVAVGTRIPFTLSGGISGADVPGGQLPENAFYVLANGATTEVAIGFIEDEYSEGTETLTLTLDDDASQTATITVKDTSVSKPVNHTPTGSVTISDTTPTQGQTLTAANTLADADGLGTITYQWLAGGTNLGIGKTYTLTANEVGKVIKVIASYTDGDGAAESVASAATMPVEAKPAAPDFTVTRLTDASTGENGGVVRYAVSLTTQPLREVTVTFTSSDTGEGVIGQPKLTFNAHNWDVAQTLLIRGVDDYLDDGDVAYSITARVNTHDVDYARAGISPLILTNLDDGRDRPLYLVGDQGGLPVKDKLQGGQGQAAR